MSTSVLQNLVRSSDTAPGERQALAQENTALLAAAQLKGMTPASINAPAASALNDAHVNGPSSIRTGLQLIPSPLDAAAALQSSASQIARLQSNPEQPTARAASEAYLTQAASQPQISLQERLSSAQNVNMMI